MKERFFHLVEKEKQPKGRKNQESDKKRIYLLQHKNNRCHYWHSSLGRSAPFVTGR